MLSDVIQQFTVQAWYPYLKRDTGCLEKVHSQVTKLIKGFKKLHYEDRLRELGLIGPYIRTYIHQF